MPTLFLSSLDDESRSQSISGIFEKTNFELATSIAVVNMYFVSLISSSRASQYSVLRIRDLYQHLGMSLTSDYQKVSVILGRKSIV